MTPKMATRVTPTVAKSAEQHTRQEGSVRCPPGVRYVYATLACLLLLAHFPLLTCF